MIEFFLLIVLSFFAILAYKGYILWTKINHASSLAKDLVFLSIRTQRKDSDLDQKNDNIQSLKQNIEIMNQILKTYSSIYSGDKKLKKLGQNAIVLETVCEKEQIKFFVGVPKDYVEGFEKFVSSLFPGSVIDYELPPKLLDQGKNFYGGYYILKKESVYPIRTYEESEIDPMESIFSSCASLDRNESLTLQLLVRPEVDGWQEKFRKTGDKIKSGKKKKSLWQMLWDFKPEKKDEKKEESQKFHLSSSQTQALDKKTEDEGYEFCMKVLAVSPYPGKAKKMVEDLSKKLNQYNSHGLNSFQFVKPRKQLDFVKHFVARVFTLPYNKKRFLIDDEKQILSIKEISSLFHFPHSRFNKNPRIRWQGYKIVAAPKMDHDGMLIGYNLYGGNKQEIRLNQEDRFRHFYLIGQTGTGKSTMLLVQAKYDVDHGNGFAMLDPHGDLCEFVLQHYPKERINDLIYIDAGNDDFPIGLNVLDVQGKKEQTIRLGDLTDMFLKLYGSEAFGPRIQDYFSNAIKVLFEQPEGGTMTEIVRLFVDPAFQKLKLSHVKDSSTRAWWDKTFNAMGNKEKQEMIPYFQAKFGQFTNNAIIRNIIGQPKNSFDIYEAMQSGKVLLVNLSKGRMGEFNSQLLGLMFVMQFKDAALKRAEISDISSRKDFVAYIDEFQNFVNPSIETILSEARKYRLGLVLAHQYLGQLGKSDALSKSSLNLKEAIFGNVGTMMAYKVGAPDAAELEKEFAPEFSSSDMVNMDKHKGIIKLSVGGQPTRPFSINVLNPYTKPLNGPEKVEIIKQICALKYGKPKNMVEKEIDFRVGA